MKWVQTCIRRGCKKVATHETVNGSFCDEHPAGPGLETERLYYSPDVVDAYKQGREDALEELKDWLGR